MDSTDTTAIGVAVEEVKGVATELQKLRDKVLSYSDAIKRLDDGAAVLAAIGKVGADTNQAFEKLLATAAGYEAQMKQASDRFPEMLRAIEGTSAAQAISSFEEKLNALTAEIQAESQGRKSLLKCVRDEGASTAQSLTKLADRLAAMENQRAADAADAKMILESLVGGLQSLSERLLRNEETLERHGVLLGEINKKRRGFFFP